MKKLLSILMLLVAIVIGANAADATTPDVSTSNWTKDEVALGDVFKSYTCTNGTVTLSTTETAWKGNLSGYHYVISGGNTDFATFSSASNFFGISASAEIDSIAVLYACNKNGDNTNLALVGWKDGTTPDKNNVEYYTATAKWTGDKAYDAAKWQTIDLSGQGLVNVYIGRQIKNFYSIDDTQQKTKLQVGENKTVNVLGIKVWLKEAATKHTVTYALGDATGGTAPTQADVAEGKKFTVAAAPTDLVAPEGQEFKCWNDGTNDYNAGAEYTMGTSNVTLTAVYQAETVKYAVTYALNGGTGTAPTQASVAEGTVFTVASADGITAPEGKRFSTWNDGTNNYAPGADYTMGTSAVTLTAQYVDIYAITKATPANGSITVSAETAAAGDKVTLTATPDFRYAFSAWNVYKTGEPATTVTVTNNEFTMPAYAVTVDATFAADPNKQVLYVTADGTVNSGDDLYAALSEDYTVTKAAWNATTVDVTDFDLVVLHESIGGKNVTGLVGSAKTANVPVLNTKSYFYNSGRFDWGTPNAGKTVNGCSQNAAYSNIASHPIFDGVEVTDGFVQVVTTAAAKAMQPVGTIVEGKEGYVLATSPNEASGKGAAIHELTATERGVASAKYLMISVSNAGLNDLSANGQLLFKNAAAYLMSDEAWTPTLATAEITLNASGYATYSKATDFTFSGAQAYKMSLDEDAATITGTEVTGKIVAGEGILLKGEAGATVTITGATWATALEGNSLKGTTTANGTKATKPDYCYTLSGDTFKKFAGAAFNDNKAYIEGTKELNSLQIVFEGEGEATAVEAVAEANAEAVAPIKVIKNGKLYIGNYNVAGQQVK